MARVTEGRFSAVCVTDRDLTAFGSFGDKKEVVVLLLVVVVVAVVVVVVVVVVA